MSVTMPSHSSIRPPVVSFVGAGKTSHHISSCASLDRISGSRNTMQLTQSVAGGIRHAVHAVHWMLNPVCPPSLRMQAHVDALATTRVLQPHICSHVYHLSYLCGNERGRPNASRAREKADLNDQLGKIDLHLTHSHNRSLHIVAHASVWPLSLISTVIHCAVLASLHQQALPPSQRDRRPPAPRPHARAVPQATP